MDDRPDTRNAAVPMSHSTSGARMQRFLSSLRRFLARANAAFERYGSDLIRWTIVAITLVAAIIGILFITRGTAVQRVRGVGGVGAAVAPSEPEFPLSVALLTGTPLLEGNRVELALNGDQTFPRLWADLRNARQSITVQMYYAHPGKVADSLGAILAERARAGVLVGLLYDAFGSKFADGYRERLQRAGVNVQAFRPLRAKNLWIVQNRSHIRGIVIDGHIGWVHAEEDLLALGLFMTG